MSLRENCAAGMAAMPTALATMVELTVADLRRPGEATRSLIERLIGLDRLLVDDTDTRVLVLVRHEALAKAGGELRRQVAAREPATAERAALIELAQPSCGRPPRCQPSLAHVLRAHMQGALARHDGRFSEAAKALDIADNTLRRQLGPASPP